MWLKKLADKTTLRYPHTVTYPRFFWLLAANFLLSPLLEAQCARNLTEACERLEQQASAETFQQAVNDCQDLTDGKCKHLLLEEDPLVLERFYHSYADSLQRLATKIENPDYRRRLEEKALARWEQYFEWMRTLPEGERDALRNSPRTRKGKKVRAAAAAIGISALAANKPEAACDDYEQLESEYFGSDALNSWLACLFYPDQPGTVDDTIFRKMADSPHIIRKHCPERGWKGHWRAFIDKMGLLKTSGRFGDSRETWIHRIDDVVRSTIESNGGD